MAEALWEARSRRGRVCVTSATRSCGAPSLARPPADAGRARLRSVRAQPSTAAPAGPAVAAARSSARRGQGDANRTAYWCPGCQAGAGRAGGVSRTDGGSSTRTCTSPCARSASARSSISAVRSRRATTCRSRSRSTRSAAGRRCTSTGRSSARFVEARASALAGREDALTRARGAAARAGGGDLRARARRAAADRGAGALPHRPPRAADLDRRGAAAGSTGTTSRSSAPTPSSSARSSASARAYAAVAPLVGHLGRDRRSSSAAGSGSARPRPGSSRTTGPRRRACCRAGFGRETDRYCVLELERASRQARSRPTPRPSSPTP